MKITLDDIVSGFKSVTKIIANFGKIETDLNDKVLYRDNPEGEPNQMQNELDMNSNRIRNLPAPASSTDAARLSDVLAGVTTTGTVLPTPSTGTDDQALSVDSSGNAYVLRDGDVLSFDQNAASSARRTIGDKLRETVSPEDFGAAGDNSTDDLAAINAALATGKTVEFGSGKTYRVTGLPSFADAHIVGNAAVIDIDTGLYTGLAGVSIKSLVGEFTIQGAGATESKGLTGGSLITGAVGATKNWSVTVDMSSDDTANLNVGEFVSIWSVAGTGDYEYMRGCWEITAIVPNVSITIKNTSDAAAWPTMTITSMTVVRAGLQLQFDDGYAAGDKNACFYIEGGDITFGTMAIIGDYNHTTGVSVGSSPFYGTVCGKNTVFTSDKLYVANMNLSAVTADASTLSLGTVVTGGCQFDGLSLAENSYASGTFFIAGGGRGVLATDSTFVGDIYCTNARVFWGQRAQGDVDIDAKYHDNTLSSEGYYLDSSVIKGSAAVDGYQYGVRALSASSATILGVGTDVKNCVTGFSSIEGSFIDTDGGTTSGNTADFEYNTAGSIIDLSGVLLAPEAGGVLIDETASNPSTVTDVTQLYSNDSTYELMAKFGSGVTKVVVNDTADSLTGDITTTASGAPSGVTLSSGHAYIGPVLIQWGKCESGSDTEESFTFSEAFPNEVYSVQLTSVENSRDPLMLNGEITLTNFGIDRWDETAGTVDFTYIAIGR